MKEIKQIRIALANLEPQLDYMVEYAENLTKQYNELQAKYNDALKQIQELNDRQNSNTQESTPTVSEIPT